MNYDFSFFKIHYNYMNLNITNAFPSPADISIIVVLPLEQPECPGYKFILGSVEFSDNMGTERVELP